MHQLRQTADGSYTLIHPEHAEAYHSFAGARQEAWDLYIASSGILQRFGTAATSTATSVLDVGLGLGYNAMATIHAWWNTSGVGGDLVITSLENDLELVANFVSGRASWQVNWTPAELMLLTAFQKVAEGYALTIAHPVAPQYSLKWQIIVGDAKQKVAEFSPAVAFDFIWQDAFSPKLNPPLWDDSWFGLLRQHARANTKLMTYSVARTVKDALTTGGWDWETIPTTTVKRSWLIASMLN